MSPRLLKKLQFEQLTEIAGPTAFMRATPSLMRTHRHQRANYRDSAFPERTGARASRARLLRRRPFSKPAEGAAPWRAGRGAALACARARWLAPQFSVPHASPQRRWVRPRGAGVSGIRGVGG